MKKIYLHLGLAKTGSTSFQNTCKKNVDALLEQGFVYPLFNSTQIKFKNIDNHSLVFNSLFSKEPQLFWANLIYNVHDYPTLFKEYKDTLNNCKKLEKDIIISGENIGQLTLDKLIELKKYLESFNAEIIPLAIVRSPYEFSSSFLQERIKTGIKKQIQVFEQAEYIKNIQEVFPNTKFIPFKDTLKYEHGVTSALLEEINIDYKDFEFIKSNESIGNIATRVQAEINRHRPRFVALQINPDIFLIPHFSLNLNSAPFKEKFYFSKEEYNTIKEDLDKENAFFKEYLGEEFCDTEIKFAEENNDIIKYCTAIIQGYENLPEKNIIIKYYKFRYITALFLSKITFGKARQKYMQKVNFYNKLLIITQGKAV